MKGELGEANSTGALTKKGWNEKSKKGKKAPLTCPSF